MYEIVTEIIIKFWKDVIVNPEEYLNAFSEHGIHWKMTKIQRFQSYSIICLTFQIQFIKAYLCQAFPARKCINPRSAKMISGRKGEECRIYAN